MGQCTWKVGLPSEVAVRRKGVGRGGAKGARKDSPSLSVTKWLCP